VDAANPSEVTGTLISSAGLRLTGRAPRPPTDVFADTYFPGPSTEPDTGADAPVLGQMLAPAQAPSSDGDPRFPDIRGKTREPRAKTGTSYGDAVHPEAKRASTQGATLLEPGTTAGRPIVVAADLSQRPEAATILSAARGERSSASRVSLTSLAESQPRGPDQVRSADQTSTDEMPGQTRVPEVRIAADRSPQADAAVTVRPLMPGPVHDAQAAGTAAAASRVLRSPEKVHADENPPMATPAPHARDVKSITSGRATLAENDARRSAAAAAEPTAAAPGSAATPATGAPPAAPEAGALRNESRVKARERAQHGTAPAAKSTSGAARQNDADALPVTQRGRVAATAATAHPAPGALHTSSEIPPEVPVPAPDGLARWTLRATDDSRVSSERAPLTTGVAKGTSRALESEPARRPGPGAHHIAGTEGPVSPEDRGPAPGSESPRTQERSSPATALPFAGLADAPANGPAKATGGGASFPKDTFVVELAIVHEPGSTRHQDVAGPTSTPSSPRGDLARSVVEQLVGAIRAGGDGTFDVQLSPEELGRVRLTLTSDGAEMIVSIAAERVETLELMRRHIDLLARDFRDLGYTSVQFTFADGDGRDPRGHAASGAYPADQGTAGDDLAAAEIPHLPQATSTADRLDLRL